MLTNQDERKKQLQISQSSLLDNVNGIAINKQVSIYSQLLGDAIIKKDRSDERCEDNDKTTKNGMDETQTQMLGTRDTALEIRGGTTSKLGKFEKSKKQKIEIYRTIDREYFTNERPTNTMEFIDKKTMKEMINSGVPYTSTSQHEVFERRIILN